MSFINNDRIHNNYSQINNPNFMSSEEFPLDVSNSRIFSEISKVRDELRQTKQDIKNTMNIFIKEE